MSHMKRYLCLTGETWSLSADMNSVFLYMERYLVSGWIV